MISPHHSPSWSSRCVAGCCLYTALVAAASSPHARHLQRHHHGRSSFTGKLHLLLWQCWVYSLQVQPTHAHACARRHPTCTVFAHIACTQHTNAYTRARTCTPTAVDKTAHSQHARSIPNRRKPTLHMPPTLSAPTNTPTHLGPAANHPCPPAVPEHHPDEPQAAAAPAQE